MFEVAAYRITQRSLALRTSRKKSISGKERRMVLALKQDDCEFESVSGLSAGNRVQRHAC